MEHYVTVYYETQNETDLYKALKKSDLHSFLEVNQNQIKKVIVVDPRNRREKVLFF